MRMTFHAVLSCGVLALVAIAPPTVLAKDRPDKKAAAKNDPGDGPRGGKQIGSGVASYYADKFVGRRTASGETYRHDALTAAHRTAPFGSKLRVTSLANGKSVTVRVNDRGPWTKGRIIDLSQSAARKIDLHRSGTARVTLHLLP